MILVTGGAGYIGSHTCVELLNAGHNIVVVDNLSNSNIKAVERVQSITGKDFPFYEIDVCDFNALDAVCQTHKPTCVIHFAGLKAVAESVSIPIRYYENNLTSTTTVLQVMEKHGIQQIIFSSSATVYSAHNTMPLTEAASATGDCTNPYAWTKYMCEQIITDTVKAKEGWTAVLLRYFNPVGAHESGLIGEDPNGIPNNLMPYVSQVAVGKLAELSVNGNDYDTHDGTGVRDYIHVLDLATGHVAAVDFCKTAKGAHAINLSTGKGSSVLDMVETFQRVNHVKVPYRIAPRRPGDNATSYASPAKAAELLHWKAEKTVDQMCEDLWRWQSANPNGFNS